MEDQVEWKSFLSTGEAIAEYKAEGFKIVALESCESSQSIQQWVPEQKVAFVLGNEAMGVAESALNQCDQILQLPMLSEQTGINVSCAFAAAAYQDFLKKSEHA